MAESGRALVGVPGPDLRSSARRRACAGGESRGAFGGGGAVELRGLERGWRASGSVDEESRFLRGLVRAGELTGEALDVAALLGHEAAARALGRDPVVVESHAAWCLALEERPGWSKEAKVRATLAALEACEFWESDRLAWLEWQPSRRAVELGVRCLERYALCPCPAHDRQRRQAVRAISRLQRDESLWPPADRDYAEHQFHYGYLLIGHGMVQQGPLFPTLQNLSSDGYAGLAVGREAIRTELVPWLLKRGDPLRERIRARRPGD